MNSPGMSTEPSSVNPETLESTKKQIRGLIQEIAQLSKRDVPPEEYFKDVLPKVVSALAAVGGAAWVYDDQRRPQLVYQINLSRGLIDPQSDEGIRHLRLIQNMFQGADAQLLAPQSGGAEENSAGNPTNQLLVVAPIQVEDKVEGVIEIFQRPNSAPNSQRGYLKFLEQMCGLATEWFKTRKLRDFSDRQSLWSKIEQFSRAVHENLDLRQTAYTIANEGRRLIGCDRVSVVLRRGKWKVEAVSGQDVFDTRSTQVQLLGKLASRVIETGEPFWFSGVTEDLSPQLETAVHDYVDESHTKTIAIIPLRRPEHATDNQKREEEEQERQYQGEILGALVVEQIEDSSQQEEFSKGVELISEHSSRALANAIDYNSIPLTPVWRLLGKSKVLVSARNLPKTVLVSIAAVAIIAALFLIPAPFKVSGMATLTPVMQREVFVHEEGEVTKVLVNHGDHVQQGQVVVELRNTELQRQYKQLTGDYDKARVSMENLEFRRRRPDTVRNPSELAQITIELGQARQRYNHLQQQVALVEEKLAKLEVASPIDGEVVSWDVHDNLMQRYVTPGQVLMTVVDPAGDWILEIKMPEKRIQHIQNALENNPGADALKVTYIMASDPGRQLEGTVTDIQRLAQPDADEGQVVKLKVAINKQDIENLRAGATATAKVHCGTAPLGYTWFHELFEFVQSRILF
ncbi:HlyD family efflux transporter periplasmic adaptor subunit [Bremerella cremea]|uniref:HlyD family efflux transporter periplasmic adaptor subunit n=2 Tax=Bremerella cremea TaxID=1031537 RepID=A0A368KPB6_9BACT|nr:HlyD family efflux transporter periplasmic adaptor subunit [Bremerella cremea]